MSCELFCLNASWRRGYKECGESVGEQVAWVFKHGNFYRVRKKFWLCRVIKKLCLCRVRLRFESEMKERVNKRKRERVEGKMLFKIFYKNRNLSERVCERRDQKLIVKCGRLSLLFIALAFCPGQVGEFRLLSPLSQFVRLICVRAGARVHRECWGVIWPLFCLAQ